MMRMPETTTTQDGSQRRVGFEFEFAGLGVEGAAKLVRQLFGGSLRRESRFEYHVEDTAWGAFRVELDAVVLKHHEYEKYLADVGIDVEALKARDFVEEAVADIAAEFVPCEVVTPPLPLEDLDAAEDLREALRKGEAKGTRDSLIYAFGFQMNPEAPGLTAGHVLPVLRAFLLLFPWLKRENRTDILRRISPYVDPFPEEYARKVVDPYYLSGVPLGSAKAMTWLLRDYVRHNPTRNRPLDLMPLLRHVDEVELARHQIKRWDKVAARPAFHYRLPNCLVGDPEWRVATEWDRWLAVERLAGDAAALRELGAAYAERPRFSLDLFGEGWVERLQQRLGADYLGRPRNEGAL